MPAPAVAEFARREEDVMVRGAAVVVVVEGEPEAGADEARPITGGAPDGGGSTALDFDAAGLSQEEKKSSSSAVASDLAGVLDVSTPSITMPFGNLCG
jgi:hypothetical protein